MTAASPVPAEAATRVRADDMATVDALIDAQSHLYTLGFRDGRAAGLLEADRDVSDAVRHMLDQLRNGGLL